MPEPPYQAPFTGRDTRCPPQASTSAKVTAGPDGDRVRVTVRGEFSLDESQALRRSLRDALGRSVRGVDLDLSGLAFWDCAALNVLLSVRREALAEKKTVAVIAASPVAERLLAFTDTRALFSPSRGDTDVSVGEPLPPREDREGGLGSEVVQLRRALQTRAEIDLARGILMASFCLSADEAWQVLVMASQNTNTKLYLLARDVITTIQGNPLPHLVQRQITAAVAKISTHNRHPHDTTTLSGEAV
ncbi:ANTAR domain-containing protein [Streptomyces sp. NPDC001177]